MNESVESSEETYDVMAYRRNLTDGYEYHGFNITLPENIVYIYPWSLAIVTIFLASLLLYIAVWSKFPKELYRCLALQHLAFGFLHVTCLTFYNLQLFPSEFLNEAIDDTYSTLDLVITFTTACLAWIVFLRVFMFRNGEELYTMSQLTIFSTLSIGVIQLYEWLMNFFNRESSLLSPLRLTSILLIMSVSVVVFILLSRTLLSSTTIVPKCEALFFMSYLLLFISSDVFLLRFNLYCSTSYILLWSIFLFSRLLIEIVCYVIFDYYFSNFLEN